MRNQRVLAGVFMMFCIQSFAQTENSRIPKIIPPSPNAAALEKFSTIPVDYSTGVPSISYPMWGWQRGKLQFSIGLSYHAGGHKVDDMASNVGLGWTTTGFWRVSRTVKGLADDLQVNGFLNSANLPQVSTGSYDGNSYYFTSPIIAEQTNFNANIAITEYNSANSPLVKEIAESQKDGEQDIFSYSINGASGRFIIDKNRAIIPLEQTNHKIEVIFNGVTPAGNVTINHFKITDDRGILYRFEYAEDQYSETISFPEAFPGNPPQNAVSGWLLTKIIDPSAQDSIVVSYTKNATANCLYETGFSENQQLTVTPNGLSAPSNSSSYSIVTSSEVKPSAVTFPDGSSIQLNYTHSRQDFLNAKALTEVVVKNYLNETIKKFQLDYGYFTASSGGTWPTSGNDNSKRLKLNSVTEFASDNVQTKTTTYTYNSTALNPRGSRNIDFWGYNVNPARNNTFLAPTIPLNATDNVTLGDYIVGADRSPDAVYAKAAVLEKIQYPTGGFVSFEYESNKVFSSVDYYVNRYETNTATWQQSSFNQQVILNIPSERVEQGIEFTFKAEDDPTGTPQPNNPPTCLSDAQDSKILRFEFVGTGGFSTFREYTYLQVKSGLGVKETINLPLGQNYRIKLVYNPAAACSFLYPFKATAKGVFIIIPEDKLAGGLRIKKIVANDGSTDVLTKEYNYNNPDGHSSATFTSAHNIPNFGYYKTTVHSSTPSTQTKMINRSSNPTITLNFNGSPLIYARVTEKELDNSSTERQYDPFITAGNGGDPEEYPFMPIQDFPNLSGLLTKTIVRDNAGVTKKEQTVTYNKVQTKLTGAENRNLKTGTIATSSGYNAKYYVVDYYSMYTSRAEPSSEQTVETENGQTITTTVNRLYHVITHYLTSETFTNSKNELRQKTYKYANEGVGAVYTSMIAKNMLNYEIEQKQLKDLGLAGVQELSRVVTNFELFQSGALPMQGNIQTSVLGNTPEVDITFNSYDDKGNINQYTAKDGVPTAFIWGYNKQYPVAKIVGKTYADAVSLSGINMSVINAPASDAAMRTELNKLRALPGCQVSTLTYRPLIGTTSETDVNGRTVYYEYDVFGRLNFIKDHDLNILKRFCYNYAGQPENCN